MGKIFDKFFYKLLVLIIVIAIIASLQDQIYNNPVVKEYFSVIIGEIPFAELIAEYLCKIFKMQNQLSLTTTTSVLTDLLRLLIMACIQPFVCGLLEKMLLPLPKVRNQILLGSKRSYEIQEEYMNSFSYKIKALLLNLIAIPPLALLSSTLSQKLFEYLGNILGKGGSSIIGIVVLLVVGCFSLIPLLGAGCVISVAILWRLLVTLFPAIANTLFGSACCIFIVLSLANGSMSGIVMSVSGLIVWLIIIDLIVSLFKRSIASLNA